MKKTLKQYACPYCGYAEIIDYGETIECPKCHHEFEKKDFEIVEKTSILSINSGMEIIKCLYEGGQEKHINKPLNIGESFRIPQNNKKTLDITKKRSLIKAKNDELQKIKGNLSLLKMIHQKPFSEIEDQIDTNQQYRKNLDYIRKKYDALKQGKLAKSEFIETISTLYTYYINEQNQLKEEISKLTQQITY